MGRFRKTSYTAHERFGGNHRFEHWYRDNTVYFITSRCREGYHAFISREARDVFWDRFAHWAREHHFTPFVTTLLSNHYHTIGYLKLGSDLGEMMRKLHGSVAKLVNDLLPKRRRPFWRERGNKDYFDGCIRDEKQCRLAYRYTLTQSVRHSIAKRWEDYPDTRVGVDIDRAVARANELQAFLNDVPYERYLQKRRAER
jgi:hypothetical protein